MEDTRLDNLKHEPPLKGLNINHPMFDKHSTHWSVCENLHLHLQLPGQQLIDEDLDSYLLTEVDHVLDV